MELKYALITLLKILISTPTILLIYQISESESAALIPSNIHQESNIKSNSSGKQEVDTNTDELYYEYDEDKDGQTVDQQETHSKNRSESEEIPNPSPLVVSGYNLPENIFNRGKPFYVEKDPLTGQIDFANKSPSPKLDDFYDYVDEEPSGNIYDKSNIDRKDGSIGSHRPSDVNQLTPNFHDFLNLPVKYNPDKYVYPLISSSYASMKVQGSVNKLHHHKDYVKTTKKPIVGPTYFTTKQYFSPSRSTTMKTTTTTTTTTPTTIKMYPEISSSTVNLMNSQMVHNSFNEEFEYYDDDTTTTKKPKPYDIYLTTEKTTKKPQTTTKDSIQQTITPTKNPLITTTKREMSLFEQLFGDYDETVTTTMATTTLMPSSSIKPTKYDTEIKTEKSHYTTLSSSSTSSSPTVSNEVNILSGSNMGIDSNYEYEDYANHKYDDNVAVPSKSHEVEDDLSIEPLHVSHTATFTDKPSENISNPFSTWVNHTEVYSDYDYQETITTSTTTTAATVRVTSLPLGDNHLTTTNREPIIRDPIIVATQNLKEKLNSEKVLPKPFEKPPSQSNIHIPANEDTVSFVVGNQQNVDGGQNTGTSIIKPNSYDSNPFRPLYGQNIDSYDNKDSFSYNIQAEPQASFQIVNPTSGSQKYPEVVGSAVTIQPLRNSEASLSIGAPVVYPGQVVDDKTEIEIEESAMYPKESVNKVVFPTDDQDPIQLPPNKELLQLSSKPMYHQLPSDLTPPLEIRPPPKSEHRPIRPPWDPRPGHFYSGKPEYNRPPRPSPDMVFKRIDNLPNILPQFRPNMNNLRPHPPPHPYGMFMDKMLVRQPLLDRPSNRPVGFFEKLQPPPVPYSKSGYRKNVRPHHNNTPKAEDRIINEGPSSRLTPHSQEQFGFYRTPPQVKIANRRNSDDDVEVETLQMIQAKNADKTIMKYKDTVAAVDYNDEIKKDSTEKSIYKVYPVNTTPIKMDVIENNRKEAVVIGTRAESPLPPSKIKEDFIFDPKDRNDAPVLKPHQRPATQATKSDFPYPLERPDPPMNHSEKPENGANNLEQSFDDETFFNSNNQWNTLGSEAQSRIVNGYKLNSQNEISVTLKSYTEKPIAVAYTPTEPHMIQDKFSMPNYGSAVIPEIRNGENDKAFTVNAMMHTNSQNHNKEYIEPLINNHRIDTNTAPGQDFQAPFQASANIDTSVSQGWLVVRDKNKTTTESAELTTMPYATTSEFDIENFKPHLEGGFKPIYSFPDNKSASVSVSGREE